MGRERAERRAAQADARDARKTKRHAAKSDRKRALAESFLPLVAADEPAAPEARGFSACPCTKDCVLHGDCLPCVAYHACRRSERPRCER